MIDFFIWAPSREIYVAVIPNILLPNDEPLARVPDEDHGAVDGNALAYPEGILASEIGPIVKVPAAYDEEGEEVTPAEIVDGYHVNIRAVGWVADMLVEGCPSEGTLFERTNILSLIEGLNWSPTNEGVPEGYVGPNGVKIIDPGIVATPARVWA